MLVVNEQKRTLPEFTAFFVRKQPKGTGTNTLLEGPITKVPPGQLKNPEAIVLEDVATTGASALKAVATLRYQGINVDHVFVVVDRLEGAAELLAESKVQLHSLFKITDFGIEPNRG
jgi:orotate phosphoribosyltransferase